MSHPYQLPERRQWLEDDRTETPVVTMAELWESDPDKAAKIVDAVIDGYQYEAWQAWLQSRSPYASTLLDACERKCG